jgi:hypothetical protein
MTLSRRRLLALVSSLPLLIAFAPVAATYARASRAVAARVRPLPQGRSDSRCAVCGATEHRMLDPTCRSAPVFPRTRLR